MKNLLLLSFILLLFSSQLKADMGGCVVYYAQFSLKNGTEFDGCFEISGYEEGAYLNDQGYNKYCSHKGVFDLLKMRQQELNELFGISAVDQDGNAGIAIYKRLEYVYPSQINQKTSANLQCFGFVLENDIVYLHPNDISKIIFKRAENSKREWVTSELIIGSAGMLDTLHRKQYWNSLSVFRQSPEPFVIGFESTEDVPVGYDLYNYNPNINVAELKRLVLLQFPGELGVYHDAFIKENHLEKVFSWPPRLRWEYDEGIRQRMRAVKQWFWEKGIVIISVNGTC
jgi:hypothetical protein